MDIERIIKEVKLYALVKSSELITTDESRQKKYKEESEDRLANIEIMIKGAEQDAIIKTIKETLGRYENGN
jgi:hypothetical protein